MGRFSSLAVLASLACVTVSTTAPAQAAASAWVGDAHAAVRLVAASATVSGSSVAAGLEFRFAPGWHGYWRTPGDAGLPPVIDWSASLNVDRTIVAWPAPTRLVVEGLQNSVYEGDVTLPATLVLKTPGAASIHVSVGYAACSKVCVPFQADLALDLPPGPATPDGDASVIATAQAAVPGAPSATGLEVTDVSFAGTGAERSLSVALRARSEPFHHPDLFVEGAGDGIPAAPQVLLEDGGRVARLTTRLPQGTAADAPLTLTLVDGDRAAEFQTTPAAPPAPAGGLGWAAALATALVGGFVLNLMPCVLPVLSIKLLGLTRHAGASSRAIRLGFVATALGIVTCFLLLAAVLAGLKGSGVALGWGIQFQQPWFLAGMATLTVLFAASFFEWLPIGLPDAIMNATGPRGRGPLIEAFLTGVFATLLATPCSAPFVGTAVGFALAQGPIQIFGIFLCLGVGMALPYGAAALLPNAARWLPRPGRWMLVLRQGLGVLLLGTAVWLLAVLSTTASLEAAAGAGIALVSLLGLLAWRAGRRNAFGAWPRVGALVLSVAPVAIAFVAVPAFVRSTMAAGWQTFDPAALQRLVAEGNTVLVDVSATWCLTCKVNDITALETPRVDARLAQASTIRMRADWSRADPQIATYLHQFQRYGIPLDVVYGPSRPDGEPLPELLTAQGVLDALDRASSPKVSQSAVPAQSD